MSILRFMLPDGAEVAVTVTALLNGGYAGRSQDDVAKHVAELAALGVPAPKTTPALYPVAPYLAGQLTEVPVQHDRTSGEAEWALVIAGPRPEDVLLTVACDHTDRDLEVHGVAWSKQAGPDVLGAEAWRLVEVNDHIDELTLTAWVGSGDGAAQTEIQRGTLAELLPPGYWLDLLAEHGLREPGTVLLSGTIPMHEGVDQFADRWRVALGDPRTGRAIESDYRVRRMPDPLG